MEGTRRRSLQWATSMRSYHKWRCAPLRRCGRSYPLQHDTWRIWYPLAFSNGGARYDRGTERLKVIETSLYPTPIYVEFSTLPVDCPDIFEVKLNPYQLFMFQPADRFVETGSNGLADWVVYAAGNTGANRGGLQCGIHTGSVLTTRRKVFPWTPTHKQTPTSGSVSVVHRRCSGRRRQSCRPNLPEIERRLRSQLTNGSLTCISMTSMGLKR